MTKKVKKNTLQAWTTRHTKKSPAKALPRTALQNRATPLATLMALKHINFTRGLLKMENGKWTKTYAWNRCKTAFKHLFCGGHSSHTEWGQADGHHGVEPSKPDQSNTRAISGCDSSSTHGQPCSAVCSESGRSSKVAGTSTWCQTVITTLSPLHRYVFRSCLRNGGGGFSRSAYVLPLHIWTQTFASHLAASSLFNQRAFIRRDSPQPIPPKAHSLRRYPKHLGKVGHTASQVNCLLNMVHGPYSTLVELNNLQVYLLIFLRVFSLNP